MHIYQYWGCVGGDENNISVKVKIRDSTDALIGSMDRTQADATTPAHMKSKFEDELIITPKWAEGGYIQFQLVTFAFNTNSNRNEAEPTHCRCGGFGPGEGPTCWIDTGGFPIEHPVAVAINQVDCWFPSVSTNCLSLMLSLTSDVTQPAWRGGNPSDGSS
jgi:hypothetical protein